MAWGILDDPYLEHVPGTALLHSHSHSDIDNDPNVKKGTGRNKHLVLVPQPSDDERDPLNWPWIKKELLFWTICFSAGLVGACGPLLAPGYTVLAGQWGVSVNDVAGTNGDLLLGLGCIMLIMAPLATKYGRRPIFLFSSAILFFCSIWSGVSHGLDSFSASRVFQGFGMAATEALVTATIGDIYFVHQRGMRIAIWGFALIGGINVTPIVNGYVIESSDLGWRWCFWFITIFFGISMVTIFFFVPETMYNREAKFETDQGASVTNLAATTGRSQTNTTTTNQALSPVTSTGGILDTDSKAEKGSIVHQEEVSSSFPKVPHDPLPAKTFSQELSPWQGHIHQRPLWRLILRQFPFFLSPAAIFGIVTYGLSTVFLVVLSTGSSVIFSLPPYAFTASQVGLVSIGPLVASIFAAAISGPLCDWIGKFMAKRNGGIYEPEFRLLLLVIMFIFEVIPFIGWGVMQSSSHDIPWIGPVMMYSLINFGQGIGSTAVVAYLIDVHRKSAPEVFAILNFTKNMVCYGFTQFVAEWIASMPILHTFSILAGCQAFCILTAIPMYIYGKRARSFVARHSKWFDTK